VKLRRTATRRHAREWALQLLFQLDVAPPPAGDLQPLFADFWLMQWHTQREKEAAAAGGREAAAPGAAAGDSAEEIAALVAPRNLRGFTERLVRGVREHLAEIDARLTAYADNWPLHRMGGVDRNVLRIALYEMFLDDQTPPVVIINEAVDLAKFFSSSESGRFVNGILDRAARDVARPPRGTAAGGRGRAKRE
jgi:N utilization substance protein B